MATTIDWSTKIISVYQADLTLVSGTLYSMDTNFFRNELKSIEAGDEGMVYEDTHTHNTEYTVAGVTYARSIEILVANGYSVQFLPNSQWSVRLEGSNNNIFDVEAGALVQNQVQVIPTNSAGLITGGSAVLPTDITAIKNAIWDEPVSSHNTGGTFGRFLRQIKEGIVSVEGSINDPSPSSLTFITDLSETTSSHYTDLVVAFIDGNLKGQSRVIASYDGPTKTITLDEALSEAPADGDSFIILTLHTHSKSQIANTVWDTDLTSYITADTAGEQLKEALIKAALAAALSA